MRKKYMALFGTVGLIAAAGIIASLASGYSTTDDVGAAVSNISEGKVKVSLGGEGVSKLSGSDMIVSPGQSESYKLNVVNEGTGKNAYGLYTKVTIDSTWDDDVLDEGEIDKDYVSFKLAGKKLKEVLSYDEQYKVGDWIVAHHDGEETVLYYTKPIEAGESSSNFLDEIHFEAGMSKEFYGGNFKFDVNVEAVQKSNSKDAIAAEWGVFPKIDSNGNITSVSEE